MTPPEFEINCHKPLLFKNLTLVFRPGYRLSCRSMSLPRRRQRASSPILPAECVAKPLTLCFRSREAAAANSQGRKPLGDRRPHGGSPGGAEVAGAWQIFRPSGAFLCATFLSRGSRPWLLTGAPSGLGTPSVADRQFNALIRSP